METKLKFGEERDGLKFWGYTRGYEQWVTPERFIIKRQKIKDRHIRLQRKPLNERLLKQGDKREIDNKVFFQYGVGYKNGELWIDPTDFDRRKNLSKVSTAAWANKNKDRKSSKNKDRYKRKMDNLILSGKKNPRQIGRCTEKAEQWRIKNKERTKQLAAKWQKENRSKIAKRRRDSISASPLLLLKSRIRCRTSEAFRTKGFRKNTKTATILGCTWSHLKSHIEKQFKKGMNWENRNLWHIDHIIPLASARDACELVCLAHFSNLQPLWRDHNLSKGKKIVICQPELPISLL